METALAVAAAVLSWLSGGGVRRAGERAVEAWARVT